MKIWETEDNKEASKSAWHGSFIPDDLPFYYMMEKGVTCYGDTKLIERRFLKAFNLGIRGNPINWRIARSGGNKALSDLTATITKQVLHNVHQTRGMHMSANTNEKLIYPEFYDMKL